jgi:putative ABC transport system permease protein
MNLIFHNFRNTLRRYKAASILNVLGLSVAFAAFAIILMQVRYDLTYDRFHPKADRIFRVEVPIRGDGSVPSTTLSRPFANELMQASSTIERGGVFQPQDRINVSADDKSFVSEHLVNITPGILQMFDFQIVAGDTAQLSRPDARLISQSTAGRLYGDADPIGQQIFTEGSSQPAQVVAVYRDFPGNSMLPNGVFRDLGQESLDDWGSWSYPFFIQLSSPDKTQTMADLLAYRRGDKNLLPKTSRLMPLTEIHFQSGGGNKATTYTLLSIALLIVLIAAINFVNFSTSLVPMRLRAVNTQRVLGNSVRAIRAAMIGEAVGLAVIGLLLAYWLIYALSTTSFTAFLNVDMVFGKNLFVLGITAAVALVTGLLAGLYPAFYITSFQPALVIKGSFGLSPRGKRLRTALISVQYVISLVLIMTALLMRTQNRYMKDYPLGFEKDNVLLFGISENLSERSEVLREELMKSPSIRGIAYADGPLVSTKKMNWGRKDKDGRSIEHDVLVVSPNFPEVLGMDIFEGRTFRQSDEQSENGVFLFNETAQKRYGLTLESRISGHTWDLDHPAEIAGFARDFHFQPLQYTIEPLALYVFGSNPWEGYGLRTAYARVDAANVASTIDFIRQTVSRMDPKQVDVDVQFLDASIGNLYAKEDRLANLISLFSALAVLISIIGVFGLVMFETQYRRKEIGLRRVHGATIGEILRLLNQNFVRIVIVCFVIAAPIAYYAVRRWLEGFAYKSPIHWWIFAVALLAVGAITMLTVTLQSYRTATENPVNSIKTE